jgi:hypothetical protein
VDVVYLCREGENEELRYSLRSLANLPHERVWIFGGAPEWATAIEHVPTDQRDTKYRVTTRALRAACEHEGVSDPFVLFNDDFYLMRRIDEVPVLHRGLVADVLADYVRRWHGGSSYSRGMAQTADLLASLGFPAPLSYELHVPLPVHKRAMLEALDVGEASGIAVLHKRTLYGNLARLGGDRLTDVKIVGGREGRIAGRRIARARSTWLSSSDASFAGLEPLLRHYFPAPSRHEPPVPARVYSTDAAGRRVLVRVEPVPPAGDSPRGRRPVTPAAQSKRRIHTKGVPMFTVKSRVYGKATDGRTVLRYTAGMVITDDAAKAAGLLAGKAAPKKSAKGLTIKPERKDVIDDAPAPKPVDTNTNLADLRAICAAEGIDAGDANTRAEFRAKIEDARAAKADAGDGE